MRGFGKHGGGRQRRGRNLLRPSLLLLMHEGPAHGYDLMERLKDFGISGIDPSMIYRALRDMENDGLVTSVWDEKETQGPPRRVYSLSGIGDETLKTYLEDLRRTRDRINNLIDQYDNHMRDSKGDVHK
ncbi:MAG TPA: PadR family transcriptional regulator [Pelolinea sp.]|nr:PadR family transcriptional regulator [Pelolinea sp.]